jgi:hypothetical protein
MFPTALLDRGFHSETSNVWLYCIDRLFNTVLHLSKWTGSEIQHGFRRVLILGCVTKPLGLPMATAESVF